MRHFLLFLSTICSLYVVAQNPEEINVCIKQIESKEQVLLKYNTEGNYVWGISFPFEFELDDHTPEGTWVRGASFYYTAEFIGPPLTESGWRVAPHWMKLDEEYKTRPDPTELNGERYPNPGYLLVRSTHYVSKAKDIQDSLAPYLQKAVDSEVYPLPVGTLREFKAKHPQLTERFLKGDSVEIIGRNKQAKIYEWIGLPVEY